MPISILTRLSGWLAIAAVGALLWAHGWLAGVHHEQDQARLLEHSQLREAFEQGQQLGIVRDRVVTEYVDRVRVIEKRGQTIIKEVPVYVSDEADNACTVPAGFVRLHDAAAEGVPLDPGAGPPHAAPSGIALSAVAGTVAGNYTACHANAEQLAQLQGYLRELERSFSGRPSP